MISKYISYLSLVLILCFFRMRFFLPFRMTYNLLLKFGDNIYVC